MKTFKTSHFLVRGFEEDSSICYLVDTIADDTRMGYFEVNESQERDNANVLAVYLNIAVFKEVFTEYQQQLHMPVFFWDGDISMTSELRKLLISMKAKHGEDLSQETKWYKCSNNKVYQLGEHEKK